jgi:SAM-dependent methyltransferase
MNLIEYFHLGYIQNRRAYVLAEQLSSLIPHNTTLLDVGCGDGRLSARILESRGDTAIKGVDILARSQSYFPVDLFDGQTIPAADGSFDVVMFVDVLHHTEDPMILLREATRVARRHIIIKDHLLDRPLAKTTLRFMDSIGNARYGVATPYNYWHERKWRQAFEDIGLTVGFWTSDFQLYPKTLNLLFGGTLHFIARLDVSVPER